MTSTGSFKTKVKFHNKIKKNKPQTFQALYKAVKVEDIRKKVAQMDRHAMQRLIAAYEAGKPLDLTNVLKHELVSVPPSIFKRETDGWFSA